MIRYSKLPLWAISAAVLFLELCGILPAQTKPPIVLSQVPAGATFQTTGTAGYLFYSECSTDGQDWRFLPSMKLGNGSPVRWGFGTPEPGTPRQFYRIRVSATGGYTAATAATQDTDGDTIPDVKEVENGTSPISPDTDADGIADNQEAANGTSATRLDMPTFTIVTAWRRAAISKTLNNGSSNPTVSGWQVVLEEAEGAYNGYTTNTFSPSPSFTGPGSVWDPVDLLDTTLDFWTFAGYTGVEPVTARNKAFRLWGHRYQQFTDNNGEDANFDGYGEVLDRTVRIKASRPMPVDWRIPYVKVSAAQPGFTAAWTAPGGQQGNPPPTVETGFFTFPKGQARSSEVSLFVTDDGPVPAWPSLTAFGPNRPGNAESRSIQVLYFTKFGTAISSGDKDGDGVTDALEKQMGLDPAKRNTDGMGYADGDQINQDILPPADGFRITSRAVDFNAKVSWPPDSPAPDKKEESLATITDLPAASKFQHAKDQPPAYDLNQALQDKIAALSPFPETVPGNDKWPIPDPISSLVLSSQDNPSDTTVYIHYHNFPTAGKAIGDQCRIWATIPEPLPTATTRPLLKVREENVNSGAFATVSVTPVTLTIPSGATVSSTHVDLTAARPTTIPTGPQASGQSMTVREKLLPVEVRDGSRVLASMPLGSEDPWSNAAIQSTVSDASIAWITGNTGTSNAPAMPRLSVRIPGATSGFNVRWRFACEYRRGNGYRASYVSDFSRPEDKVGIPQRDTAVHTDPMPASQEWKIHEHPKWSEELSSNGFFGGLATVFLKLDNQPEIEVCRFRIGGQNPDQSVAKKYITDKAGATYWYAYAVAKHETFGRVRGRFYNQFYTDYQPEGGLIGDDAKDMGWAAWAKGWPIYNLDRKYKDNKYTQNGPGGYGMFQLTLGPKKADGDQTSEAFVSRAQIWNWQANCDRAITELQGKMVFATSLETALEGAYTDWPQVDAATTGRLNGRDAMVLTYYNGMFGGQLKLVAVGERQKLSCWFPKQQGTGNNINRFWIFLENANNYVQRINTQIE